jgi:hypothetical protein
VAWVALWRTRGKIMVDLKQPITLTFDGLVQKAVDDELKKRAAKGAVTVASQAMKAAGLDDIKVLLSTFGVTPDVISRGVRLAFDYLEAQAAAKGGYVPPGGTPGPMPGDHSSAPPRSPPPSPPSQSVTKVDVSPEATYNRHLGLIHLMINTYGDIHLSEALKRFVEGKSEIIQGIGTPPPIPTPAPAPAPAPAPG